MDGSMERNSTLSKGCRRVVFINGHCVFNMFSFFLIKATTFILSIFFFAFVLMLKLILENEKASVKAEILLF